MSKGLKVIIPDVHVPVWVSPIKAREFMEEKLDVISAKWGEAGALIATYIGLYTVREIYDKIRDLYPDFKLQDVMDVLMEMYEDGYIDFKEAEARR